MNFGVKIHLIGEEPKLVQINQYNNISDVILKYYSQNNIQFQIKLFDKNNKVLSPFSMICNTSIKNGDVLIGLYK